MQRCQCRLDLERSRLQVVRQGAGKTTARLPGGREDAFNRLRWSRFIRLRDLIARAIPPGARTDAKLLR